MTDKEMEQKIRESADNTEIRDFDAVWQEIEPRITEQPKQRKRKLRRWMPIAASFLCVAVASSVALPFLLSGEKNNGDSTSSDDIRYLDTELERKEVASAEFFTKIEQSNLNMVDLSSFEFLSSFIYHDDNDATKGGYVEAYNTSHYFKLTFYDTCVDVSELSFSELDLSYTTTKGVNIDYRYNQVNNIYFISVEYKNINYYMEYTYGGGDITEFFEEFFR
ncbi:MAG: hypothetical protein IJX30_05485 [Clostridia bacterium]|nr:hypothetical protein [Clostridia bacterium]